MAISNNNVGVRPGVCTSSTRPTAPYEGQHIYETDTDLTYIWGGSAWQQVSGGTAVGNSGLVYITSVVATSGSTIDISNCFTTTYDSYKIVISNFTANTTVGVDVQLLASGTPTTSGYYWMYSNNGYGTTTSYAQQGSSTGTFFAVVCVADGSVAGGSSFDLFNPKLANRTTITYTRTDPRSGGGVGTGVGYLNNTTQYDGMRLLMTGATISNCRVTIYGYRQA